MTEENQTQEQEGEAFDLEQVEQEVDQMHDALDNIKNAGSQLPQVVQANLPEDADDETVQEYQRVANKAARLQARVEQGDRNVVRGGQ